MKKGDDNWMYFSSSSQEGKRNISVSGLKPCTEYTYVSYVKYKGVEYPSIYGGGFTTDLPDISGTWTCTEEYYPHSWSTTPNYKTYSLTLNKDGSASCSEYDSIVSGSWSFNGNGTVRISIMNIATQTVNTGTEWSGKVDSIENPTKVTGSTYIWNYNQYGYFRGDSHSIVMTR